MAFKDPCMDVIQRACQNRCIQLNAMFSVANVARELDSIHVITTSTPSLFAFFCNDIGITVERTSLVWSTADNQTVSATGKLSNLICM